MPTPVIPPIPPKGPERGAWFDELLIVLARDILATATRLDGSALQETVARIGRELCDDLAYGVAVIASQRFLAQKKAGF